MILRMKFSIFKNHFLTFLDQFSDILGPNFWHFETHWHTFLTLYLKYIIRHLRPFSDNFGPFWLTFFEDFSDIFGSIIWHFKTYFLTLLCPFSGILDQFTNQAFWTRVRIIWHLRPFLTILGPFDWHFGLIFWHFQIYLYANLLVTVLCHFSLKMTFQPSKVKDIIVEMNLIFEDGSEYEIERNLER